MVEGTPLLREHTPKGYRKFESSRLRQMSEKAPEFQGLFYLWDCDALAAAANNANELGVQLTQVLENFV